MENIIFKAATPEQIAKRPKFDEYEPITYMSREFDRLAAKAIEKIIIDTFNTGVPREYITTYI